MAQVVQIKEAVANHIALESSHGCAHFVKRARCVRNTGSEFSERTRS